MIADPEFWVIVLTLIGGFGAVIGLLLSFKSDLVRISERSEARDDELSDKLNDLCVEFHECRATHRECNSVGVEK